MLAQLAARCLGLPTSFEHGKTQTSRGHLYWYDLAYIVLLASTYSWLSLSREQAHTESRWDGYPMRAWQAQQNLAHVPAFTIHTRYSTCPRMWRAYAPAQLASVLVAQCEPLLSPPS